MSAHSHLGPVTLTVANLDRAIQFYRDKLGLKLHHREGSNAALGAGGADLLVLYGDPAAARPAARSTGLYHVAILLPDRISLARELKHLIDQNVPLQGAADHCVSEALYLADPEGNGIEIYHDRPPETWEWRKGEIHMTTDPLDVENLLAELIDEEAPFTGMPPGTKVGHVHLRVSDVPAAERFYREVLGLDLTTRYGPSASFLSWDGYHHHLAINAWGSLGASSPPAGALGLKDFVLHPTEARLRQIEEKVKSLNIPAQRSEAGLHLKDPSDNSIVLRASNRPT